MVAARRRWGLGVCGTMVARCSVNLYGGKSGEGRRGRLAVGEWPPPGCPLSSSHFPRSFFQLNVFSFLSKKQNCFFLRGNEIVTVGVDVYF
jgi:hypothetical protein